MSFDIAKVENEYPEVGGQMIEPMKIWKLPAGKEDMLSDICSKGEYFLEEKIDGAFYQFVKTEHYSYLFGRTVSVKNGLLTEKGANVPHIMEALACLPQNTIIIGEIYYPGGTSKTVTSVMGCLPVEAIKRQKDNPIHYYIHDIIEYDGVNLMNEGAESRYSILEAVWNKHNLEQYDFLRLAVKVDTDLEAEISRILKSGGEGAVLKKRDYPYTPGKRPAWSTIKIKQMDSIDLVCMGFCPPTKEYTGKELETWPYWAHSLDGIPTMAETEDDTPLDEREGYLGVYEGIPVTFYKNYMLTDKCQYGKPDWHPITKYYYLGWYTAIKVGAYDNDGNLVELGTVSSGLTEENKRAMSECPDDFYKVTCAIDCMSIDKKEHTLRHPAFKAWRFDKDDKDCIISEVFA